MTPGRESRPVAIWPASNSSIGSEFSLPPLWPSPDGERDKFAYVKALRGRADLTLGEFRLLITIWSYTDPEGRHAHPGTDRLANDLGHHGDRRVRRMIPELLAKGYLVTSRVGGGRKKATEYELAMPTNPGQENPGQDDPSFTNPGQIGTPNPGQGDPQTRVMATLPSSLYQDTHQGDVGLGEADAPPPSRQSLSWAEYTEACTQRGLAPTRLAWIRGSAHTDGTFKDPKELEQAFFAAAGRHDQVSESRAANDWMNR